MHKTGAKLVNEKGVGGEGRGSGKGQGKQSGNRQKEDLKGKLHRHFSYIAKDNTARNPCERSFIIKLNLFINL